jgi:hypothetical protein
MHFTRTELKNKKPVNYGTNKMGQYYSNIRVPIKNYTTTPIAKRIDSNMTNLNVPENLTNKNLNQFIQPALEPVVLEPEIDLNIFNNNYDNKNVNKGLAEKTRKFEEDYEEMKITFNKNLNTDSDLLNYKSNTEINMNVNVELTEKMEITLNKDDNSNLNIFNYDYDNINVNEGLAEKTKKFEEEYDEMKLLLNKNNTNKNTQMNLQTDDKNFNSFLTVLNEPNKTIDDTDDAFINKPYTKTQITSILKILQLTNVTIENVYQENYKDNVNATGLGDFIRGSYFLMQFCQENQLLYKINMLNHPISRFLEIYQNKQPSNYKNINKFDLTNFNAGILDDNILTNIHDHTINNDFIYFLKDQTVHNKTIYTYLISYPTIIIDEEHKKYMQHLLKPTKYLSLLVDEQLTKLDLYEKEYTVIHVRYGDDYLIKNETDINLNHLNTIKQKIDYLGSTNKILLISDNIVIKTCITNLYPNIKTHFNEITHTGEGIQLDTNKLKNTMIDFYLFSRAKNVFAFSVYKHGTGFSKWAAETYSVPYTCHFLQ